MQKLFVLVGSIGAALTVSSGELLAQPTPSGPGDVIRELGRMDAGTLSIALIFGTGFVASLLWGIGAVVTALRQDLPNGERLRGEMAALQERVAALEASLAAVRTDDQSPVAR